MVLRIVSSAFVVVGLFFAFAGVVGLLRMPDAYCRMQSSTNISTLGLLGAAIGGLIHSAGHGEWEVFVKIALIALFVLFTSPVAGHSIARAAYHHGVKSEKELVCDEYGEDEIDD